MSEPSFAQEERRSLVLPTLLAIAFLGLAVVLGRHFVTGQTVAVELVRTEVVPTTSVFKSDSIVIAPDHTDHTLFVVPTIRVGNKGKYPIFVDDYQLTLTDSTGAQLAVKGVQKPDLANLGVEFPRLKPLIAAPLLRDTSIDPGKSAEGAMVFSFPLQQSVWDSRKSAELEVDIYHGHPLFATLPKP